MSYDKQATAALIAASIMDELHPHILRAIAKALDGESKKESQMEGMISEHDLSALTELAYCWHKAFGKNPTTVSKAISFAETRKNEDAKNLLSSLIRALEICEISEFIAKYQGCSTFNGYCFSMQNSKAIEKKWFVYDEEVAK